MKQTLLLVIFLLLGKVCNGQTAISNLERKENSERKINLTDSLIQKEVSMFTFKGKSKANINVWELNSLIEFPLKGFKSNYVHFDKGSTYVHIYLKEENEVYDKKGVTKLDSIFLVTHSHFWVRFPRSAFEGLYYLSTDISNVEKVEANKKRTTYSSDFYKVFQSKDKRRLYIYCIGGKEKEQYEVTWVIQDERFVTRIVDPIK